MKVGNVSFGSTYAIKYNYTRNYESKGLGDRSYKSEDGTVDEFIREFDRRLKGKNDVSSFCPEKNLYFLNVKNNKDKKLEFFAGLLGIEIKKVNPKDMRGTQIVSVGSSRDGIDGELKTISRMITSYRLMKEMEDRDHRRWLDNAD